MDTPTPSAPAAAPSSTSTAPSTPAASSTTPAAAKPVGTPPPNSKFADKTPEAPAAAQTEARKEAERRRYKLKIDGEVREEELSHEEAEIRLQKAYAAEKRMAEAARIRKEDAARREALRSGKLDALDPEERTALRKAIEDQILSEYQEQALPEHERRILEAQREADKYRTEVEQYRAEQERMAQEHLERQVFEQTEREFTEALEAEGVLKTRQTLAMMAEVATTALDNGIELSPRQMVAEVNRRLADQTRHVISGLKGDQLAKFLGDAVVKEILRHSVEKFRAAPPPPATPAPALTEDDGDESPAASRAKGLRTYADVRRSLRRD